ncbi:MAG: pyruvate kinase [Oscillospiraceae bacterium]|nr:pyruvate kinase [Oscillospiraceae bacterium]MDE6657045.1 pyruvate kinase [Oscillospiraceae bacterium]
MSNRKTKIICTIGPATDCESVLRDMMLSGMNIARFNFSHGDYATHKQRFETIVKLREELNLPIATMLDTKGPEVRLRKFVNNEPVEIFDGDLYTLTTNDVPCTNTVGSITFKNLPQDVSVGTRILINDGVIELLAEKITRTDVICRVIHGGVLSNNKGINVPGVRLSMPYLSDADMNDLEFGAKMGYDFIAASFVRSSADINYLRRFTESLGWFNVRIIAKIENLDGVQNIDEILDVADGIMVARGDMGVEIPFEQIPAIQKKLIQKGYNAGKQVITATQMLESMINNPRPTRAEITDVANAIYDGTSAIMLSGETAAGQFPVEVVRTMDLIASTTEGNIDYKHEFASRKENDNTSIAEGIAHAAVTTAHDLNAKAIIAVTKRGKTARLISKFRPAVQILGCTTDEDNQRKMNMSWGVIPFVIDEEDNTDTLFSKAVAAAKEHGHVQEGDLVVITAGVPLGISGMTNLMKVERI